MLGIVIMVNHRKRWVIIEKSQMTQNLNFPYLNMEFYFYQLITVFVSLT